MSRTLRTSSLVVILALTLGGASPAHAGLLARLSPNLVPYHGTLIGIFAKQRHGRSHGQEIRHVERQIGRRFAIDHFYLHFDDALNDRPIRATIRAGRIPLINWAPETAHGIVTWSSIAAGQADPTIDRAALQLKALHHPVMLALHHEPEDDTPRFGQPADYRLAFQHIVQRMRADGAGNVVFVCILEAYTYDGGNGGIRTWYPGSSYVDWAAADGYNWAPGRAGYTWRSFRATFTGFEHWGEHHTKPLMIAEFGTQEKPGDPRAKARWFHNAGRRLARWHSIKAVVYFNSNKKYPWWIDTSRRSLTAFSRFADRRMFHP